MGDLIDNDYCDGDYSTIWEETTPKAKKEYKCIECYGVITVGEKYAKTSSLYDGSWTHYRYCQGCCNLRKLVSAGFTMEPRPGGLAAHMMEENSDTYYIETFISNTKARVGEVPKWLEEKLTKP